MTNIVPFENLETLCVEGVEDEEEKERAGRAVEQFSSSLKAVVKLSLWFLVSLSPECP